MIKILHIIQELTTGGAALAMIAIAKYSSRSGNFHHSVISLLPASDEAVKLAKDSNMVIYNNPDRTTILEEIKKTDIVHVNFWNNTEIYELLRSNLPEMRLLIWFHIAGDNPPQIITRQIVDFADFALACSPYTYNQLPIQNLPEKIRLEKTGMVYGATDFERISNISLKLHNTFNVGYIGTVNFIKMHRNYVSMSASINIPDIKFIVCGRGIENFLKQEAQQLGALEKFDFRGYVNDIKSVIEILDVYGYPLCEDTYAASELNLQEVMYAGVPPVVFPYGGVKLLVINEKTGLIVDSELEYKQAIEYLYHHPEERKRLGNNAREYAKQVFGAENAAKKLNPIYEKMMKKPKKLRIWGMRSDLSILEQPVTMEDLTGIREKPSGAKLFIEGLGDKGKDFITSMTSIDIEALFEAERNIANSSPLLQSGPGGILDCRHHYPEDPYLKLWTALVLQKNGNYSRAITELLEAINFIPDNFRIAWYLAQVAEKAGNIKLAKEILQNLIKVNPSFTEAKNMISRIDGMDKDTSTYKEKLQDAINAVDELRHMDLLEEANSTLLEFIEVYKDSPDLLNLQAEIKHQMGQIDEARNMLFNLSRRFPEHPRILNNLGAILRNDGNIEEAMSYLIKALKFEPDNRSATLNLADILVSLEKYEEAINILSSYVKRNSDDEEINSIVINLRSKHNISDEYTSTEQFQEEKKLKEPLISDSKKSISVPVATSIAPKRNMEQQINALLTWKKAGFSIISFNSVKEIQQIQPFFPDITFVEVINTGEQEFGKPYIYLTEILNYFRNINSNILGLVNSDIYLNTSGDFLSFICTEAREAFVFGSRMDVESLEDKNGTMYTSGFDFFFFDKSFLSLYPSGDVKFCLGLPWWDYWFPFIAIRLDLPVKKLVTPVAYHVIHKTMYSDELYYKFSNYFIKYFDEKFIEKFIENTQKYQNNYLEYVDSLIYLFKESLYKHIKIDIPYNEFIDNIKNFLEMEADESEKYFTGLIFTIIKTIINDKPLPIEYEPSYYPEKNKNEEEIQEGIDQINELRGLGLLDEAFSSLSDLLLIYPDSLALRNLEGEFKFQFGLIDEAKKSFLSLVETFPVYGQALNNLGVIYLNEGDMDKAFYYYKKAIEANKDDIVATLNLADLFVTLDKCEEAEKLLSSYLQRNPGVEQISFVLESLKEKFSLKKEEAGIKEFIEINNKIGSGHGQLKVSAIVSTYKSEKNIRDCLEDLISQSLYKKGQVEIIVIDSCSPENEKTVVEEFQKYYPRIKYLRTFERETIYCAWNRGISMACGIYITNHNTDDRLKFDTLERFSDYLDNNPNTVLVHGDQKRVSDSEIVHRNNITGDGHWKWFPFSRLGLLVCTQVGSQPMWRRSLHEKYGYFDPLLTILGDRDFFIRISQEGDFHFIPEVLGTLHMSEISLSHNLNISNLEHNNIFSKYTSREHIANILDVKLEHTPTDIEYQILINNFCCQFAIEAMKKGFAFPINQIIELCSSVFLSGPYTDILKQNLILIIKKFVSEDLFDKFIKAWDKKEIQKILDYLNDNQNFKLIPLENGYGLSREQSLKKDIRVLVSIIIPVHNQLNFTRQCIDAIKNTVSEYIYEIILINNASTDDTENYLENIENITVINNINNESYSYVNNQGAKVARGKYLIFLNNDTKPLTGWCTNIVEEFNANPYTGVQGAKLLYANGTIQHAGMVFGKRPGRLEEPYHAYLCAPADASFVNRKREVQFVTGACLAIRKELFEQVGGFDEAYVFGWEDTDLCMKVKQIGAKIVYNPEVVLYHFESVTKKLREENGENILSCNNPHEHKNRKRFFEKWGNIVKWDAELFYSEDGFCIHDGKILPLHGSDNLITSFSPLFWERNYNYASKVLLKSTGALGDTLLITCVVSELKRQFPYLNIYVSGSETVEWILRHHPAIEEILPVDSEKEKNLKPDVTIDYRNIISRLPEYYNGIGLMDIIGNIAGIHLEDRAILYTITPEEKVWAEEQVNMIGLKELIVGLQFTASKDIKRSYPEGEKLIDLLYKKYPGAYFFGFGNEHFNVDNTYFYDCAERKIPFRHQIALACYCNAFITVDSIFFHVGYHLCHKPTLCIFGPTNPLLFREADFISIQNKELDCLSCYWQRACNIECMNDLNPEGIVSAFSRMIDKGIPPLPELKPLDIVIRPGENYEETLGKHLYKRQQAILPVLSDPHNILPVYAHRWNGVKIGNAGKISIGKTLDFLSPEKNVPALQEYTVTDSLNRLAFASDLTGGFSNKRAAGKIPSPFPSPLYLNLGCGKDIRDGFVNIDLFSDDRRVVGMDVRKLDLPDNCADGILASDILEHFSHRETGIILREWARVLKPGGELVVRCPSLYLQIKAYWNGIWDADVASYMIFGGQTNPGDYHCTGFDEKSMRKYLTSAGLEVTSFEEIDTPQDKGFINLNMTVKARKPVNSRAGISEISLTKPVIYWEGSQFVYHSLALINRELCLQLIDRGFDVTIIPYENHQFKADVDTRFHKISERLTTTISRPADIHVRHQWPPKFTAPPAGGHWVIIQPWEYGRLRKEWVEPMRELIDEIWIPSNFVRKTYIESGIQPEKVFVIPNGFNPEIFNPSVTPFPVKTDKKFKFLFVGGTIWRKGADVLVNAYIKTFTASDDVSLIIKDIGHDSFYKGMGIGEQLKKIQENPSMPEIIYIKDFLSEKEMAGLYTACDCLLHPYRGEGFAFPVIEAMACGKPVIVTKGGATDDFCKEEFTFHVSAEWMKITFPDMELVGNEGMVLEPSMDSLMKNMRDVYENYPSAMEKADKALEFVKAHYTWDKIGNILVERINKLRNKPVLRYEKIKILMKRGETFFTEGNIDEAMKCFSSIIDIEHSSGKAHSHMATLYWKKQDRVNALKHIKEAIKFAPCDADVVWNYGHIMTERGQKSDAFKVYKEYLSKNPHDAEIKSLFDKLVKEEEIRKPSSHEKKKKDKKKKKK